MMNVTQRLVRANLLSGRPLAGEEVALRAEHVSTYDGDGLRAIFHRIATGPDRARNRLNVHYQEVPPGPPSGGKADRLLRATCHRLGIWFSAYGNGVGRVLHQQHFGQPGATLLGTDRYACACGALGMLGLSAGGAEAADAMAGEPFRMRMPAVWGVELVGAPPDRVSAKDLMLEMLRRYGTGAARGTILEYYGPGLEHLSVMDRHVVATMGAELGATTSTFPSDHETRRYLRAWGREEDWMALAADRWAGYDRRERVDLSELEPLIALPTGPDHVLPVRALAGREIGHVRMGSSANAGYRDFAVAAMVLWDRRIHDRVSLDVCPTTRDLAETLTRDGHLLQLQRAGARLGPAADDGGARTEGWLGKARVSLRTEPSNLPALAGAARDAVYLCSAATAAASALTGAITDPRELGRPYPRERDTGEPVICREAIVPPAPTAVAAWANRATVRTDRRARP